MPYEIEFQQQITAPEPEIYINECCFGGDVVSGWIEPAVLERYEHVRAEQEDWGWFLWFRRGTLRLAIDIFCDDPATGSFRIHLTTREHRRFRSDRIADTPELEALKDLVIDRLTPRVGGELAVTRLDADYGELPS